MLPKPITAFGVEYPSIREAASAFGLPHSALRFRLQNNLESEVALVCTDQVTCRFLGLDARAYHSVPWNSDLVTTREIVEHYRPDLLAAYDAANPDGEYKYYKGGDTP